jgi:hypothetical protein
MGDENCCDGCGTDSCCEATCCEAECGCGEASCGEPACGCGDPGCGCGSVGGTVVDGEYLSARPRWSNVRPVSRSQVVETAGRPMTSGCNCGRH